MFDLKRPCKTCPFLKSNGASFALGKERLGEIFEGPAFQCHGTVDYENFDDAKKRQGRKPQQCAGLMALLHREGRDNQIMQVAQRLIGFDAAKLDNAGVFESIDECVEAHEIMCRKKNHLQE